MNPELAKNRDSALFISLGLLRITLAAVVAAFAIAENPVWPVGVYLAAGIGAAFGLLVVVGWPSMVRRESLVGVLLDSLTVSLVFVSTGGGNSLLFPLYLLAVLGVIGKTGTSGVVKFIVAATALVGSYLAATVVLGQSLSTLLSSTVGFQVALILFFCISAALVEARLRGAREDNQRALSELAAEREYAEEISSVVSRVGPTLARLAPEEILKWAAETVHESLKVSYAHVARLDGYLHQTAAGGDGDVYPSWWHPEIQRLVLWSCRTGRVQRNGNTIHGIESFLAVPMADKDGNALGAIVVGGRKLGSEGERSLKLIASSVSSALRETNEDSGERAPDAAGETHGSSTRMKSTASVLAEVIALHDPHLGEHSRAVSNISILVGRAMSLDRDQMDALEVGALLHDIGKIGLPDDILHKPMVLSVEEREIMKRHPVLGAKILNSAPELAPALSAVKHHHESFDGSGYPEGLQGEGIPIAARIILVVDAFDSMTRGRPYRHKLSVREALEEIVRCSGAQFDPEVVEILRSIAEDPRDQRNLFVAN